MPKQTKPATKEQKTKDVLMLHDALPLRRGGIYSLPAEVANMAIKVKIAIAPTKQHRAIGGIFLYPAQTESAMTSLHDLIASRQPQKD